MAGSISATTALAIAGLAVGGAGTAFGIYNGQKQAGAQQDALKKQTTAQQQATGAALSTERQGEIAQGAANQKTPNIASILQTAASKGTGASSTMLTGPGGVSTPGSNLGGNTLLGS